MSFGFASATVTAGIGTGAFSLMLLILIAIVVPVAAVAFSRSGRGLENLGKGRFAVDFEHDSQAEADDDQRHEELRQMIEARAWRREARGEAPGDSEAEIERLLGLPPGTDRPEPGSRDPESGLRDEVRQVVIARNESRLRRGESPLDVESEIDRLLGDSG